MLSDVRRIQNSNQFSLALFFHPSFQVSFFYRLSHTFYLKGFVNFARFFCFLNRLFCHCDIHYKSIIEGGVLFPHANGIVIGEGVVIKKDSTIFHQTTIGGSEFKSGYPILEEGVNLYPGTVVAGVLTIGEWARIGPNVYLTSSVSSHTRISPAKNNERKNNDV